MLKIGRSVRLNRSLLADNRKGRKDAQVLTYSLLVRMTLRNIVIRNLGGRPHGVRVSWLIVVEICMSAR